MLFEKFESSNDNLEAKNPANNIECLYIMHCDTSSLEAHGQHILTVLLLNLITYPDFKATEICHFHLLFYLLEIVH